MHKVLLSIPPNYCFTYDFPPLGTPMLAGFLKERGVEVHQADYNMGYLGYWRRRVLGETVFENVPTRKAKRIIQKMLNRVFRQKRDRGYYYSPFLEPDHIGVDYADDTNSSFPFVERLLCSEHLTKYVEDEKENPFLNFFLEEDVLSLIEEEGIKLVGISIIAPSQVIGAFTLGRLIKRNLGGVHVSIGGQWATLYREALKRRPDFDRFFDSVILFEGETPLYHLIQSLAGNNDLSSVPNLIYRSDSGWKQTAGHSKENVNALACPDFDDLPLSEYGFAQQEEGVALTYQTARGCYWNKCIYCVDLPMPKQGYQERDTDLVIEDLKKLVGRYEMSFMEISNAVMSPSQLRRLSERMISEGLELSWWCFARLETELSKVLFELAREAGCKSIAFGFESGSQRVLDFVKKGIHTSTMERVIRDCHQSGIEACLQAMIGLPTESVEEALDTIKALVEIHDCVGDVAFNTYYLTPACEVYSNPSQYGIEYRNDPGTPFKFFHEFSHLEEGLSRERSGEFMDLYYRLLHKKNPAGVREERAIPEPEFSKHELHLTIGDDTVSLEVAG